MKVSLNWIKDYVPLPEDLSLTKLSYDLTMSTVEVEGAVNLADKFEKMLVGEIIEIIQHPNADKLKICRTDIGGGEIKEIVCGGSNLEVGMKVLVACPGSVVRWHGEGEPVELGVAKLRGVESFGMICASSEVGLFDLFPFEDEATIVDLSHLTCPAGTPVAQALNLNDIILEIDNKSLTNRPDLWGHYGIARELAALYNLPLAPLPAYEAPANLAPLTITVEDTVRCPRYMGAKIEGLSVKDAPFEMQSRLWRVGMRPINALVDITNYVMLATGQPTHAFDADNIKGHINVRRAGDGEKLALLNGKELALCADDLVIADDEGAVGLAGVMGGSKDSVLPETHTVILEMANFEALSIRRTAARYDNRTDAATRYEKAIDPERCEQALSLSMKLFAELYPEMQVTGLCDIYPEKLAQSEITLSLDWLHRRLGKRLPNDEIAEKLERLGFTVAFDGDALTVLTPTWRSTGDVSIENDIMEEVARMHGFENFEPTPIVTSFEGIINQKEVDIDRKMREYFALRCGMREIFTYPWMHDTFVKATLQNFDGMLTIAAPPTADESHVRSSLIPNLCMHVAGNLRFYHEFAIFESAQVMRDENYAPINSSGEVLPFEHRNLAGAAVAPAAGMENLFRRVKGMLEALPANLHIEPFTFERGTQPLWANDVVWLNIIHGGAQVGNLALLSKKAAIDCGIKNSAVVIFELDLDMLKPYPSRTNTFTHLADYPTTEYDVSLLFDTQTKWSEIYTAITASGNGDGLLQNVAYVGEYRGEQIPQGKKSVTIRLTIGSLEKTLTSKDIEQKANSVVKRLTKTLGAETRS